MEVGFGYGGVRGEGEKCPRCGTTMYGFSKKYSHSVGDYYCVKCAEALDRDYLARTTCALCGKALGKSDVKFVMSSKFFNGNSMPIVDRLLCESCHPKVASRGRDHAKSNAGRLGQIRSAVRKSIMKSMYARA